MSSGAVTIVPPIAPPNGTVPIEQVSNQLIPSGAADLLKYKQWILIALIVAVILIVIVVAVLFGLIAAFVAAVVAGAAAAGFWAQIQKTLATAAAAQQLQFVNFTPAAIAQVPPRPDFQIVAAGTAPPPQGTGTADSAQAAAFRSATSVFFTNYTALPSNPQALPALNIAALHTTLLARIDPVLTVAARINGLISLPLNFPWKPLDPLEPIMAGPVFPSPCTYPSRPRSTVLLPGVDLDPPDSLGLLKPIRLHRGYMVGLNHEMARQFYGTAIPPISEGATSASSGM